MRPVFKLTVYQHGAVARLPVEVDEERLMEALLMASSFSAEKATAVLDCVNRLGVSEYTEGPDRPVYVVEKLSDAEAFAETRANQTMPMRPTALPLPDRPIWSLSTR